MLRSPHSCILLQIQSLYSSHHLSLAFTPGSPSFKQSLNMYKIRPWRHGGTPTFSQLSLTFTRLSWVFIDFMALFIAFFGFMSAQLGAFGFHDTEVWQFAFSAPTPKERRTRRWIFQGESWLSWKWNMWKWREKNIKNCTILYLVWESLLGIRKVSKSAKWKVWRNGSMWELHIRHHWVHSGCQLRHDHPCGML